MQRVPLGEIPVNTLQHRATAAAVAAAAVAAGGISKPIMHEATNPAPAAAAAVIPNLTKLKAKMRAQKQLQLTPAATAGTGAGASASVSGEHKTPPVPSLVASASASGGVELKTESPAPAPAPAAASSSLASKIEAETRLLDVLIAKKRRLLLEIGALVKLRDTFTAAYCPTLAAAANAAGADSGVEGGSALSSTLPVPASASARVPPATPLQQTQMIGSLRTPSGVGSALAVPVPSPAQLELLLSSPTQTTLAFAAQFYERAMHHFGAAANSSQPLAFTAPAELADHSELPSSRDSKQQHISITVTAAAPVPAVSQSDALPVVPPSSNRTMRSTPGRITKRQSATTATVVSTGHPQHAAAADGAVSLSARYREPAPVSIATVEPAAASAATAPPAASHVDSAAATIRQLNFTTPPRAGGDGSRRKKSAAAAAAAAEPSAVTAPVSAPSQLSLFERAKQQREAELQELIASRTAPAAAIVNTNGWTNGNSNPVSASVPPVAAPAAAPEAPLTARSAGGEPDTESAPVKVTVTVSAGVLAPPPAVIRQSGGSRDWSATVNALASGTDYGGDATDTSTSSSTASAAFSATAPAISGETADGGGEDELMKSCDGFGSMRFTASESTNIRAAVAANAVATAIVEAESTKSVAAAIEAAEAELTSESASVPVTAPVASATAAAAATAASDADAEDDDRSVDGDGDVISRYYASNPIAARASPAVRRMAATTATPTAAAAAPSPSPARRRRGSSISSSPNRQAATRNGAVTARTISPARGGGVAGQPKASTRRRSAGAAAGGSGKSSNQSSPARGGGAAVPSRRNVSAPAAAAATAAAGSSRSHAQPQPQPASKKTVVTATARIEPPPRRAAAQSKAFEAEEESDRSDSDSAGGQRTVRANTKVVAAATAAAADDGSDDPEAAAAAEYERRRRIESMMPAPKTSKQKRMELAAKEAIASFRGVSLDEVAKRGRERDTEKLERRLYGPRVPPPNGLYSSPNAASSPIPVPLQSAAAAVTAVAAARAVSPVRSVSSVSSGRTGVDHSNAPLLLSPSINPTSVDREHYEHDGTGHHRPVIVPLRRRSGGPTVPLQPPHPHTEHSHAHTVHHHHAPVLPAGKSHGSPPRKAAPHTQTQPVRSPAKTRAVARPSRSRSPSAMAATTASARRQAELRRSRSISPPGSTRLTS